jgi:hypothetical protein
MKKFFIYIFILGYLSACESAREGFTLKKKDNSDEFLVEKKNPLVMPPEYGNLPAPDDFQKQKNNNDPEDFEKVIVNSKTKKTNDKIKNSNIEKSVLEKIN